MFAVRLNNVRGYPDHELIYIDEAGFNLHSCRTRGRAAIGNRAVRVVNCRKGPNVTCILAVSATRGIIHQEFRQGGVNAEMFHNFMERTVAEAGNGYVTFILDNAPCHRQMANINLMDNHEFRFLPAYNLFLNIVENAWSAWKAAVKQELAEQRPQLLQQTHAERMAALIDMGDRHFDVITVEKCGKWYRKSLTYINRLIREEDILQDHA